VEAFDPTVSPLTEERRRADAMIANPKQVVGSGASQRLRVWYSATGTGPYFEVPFTGTTTVTAVGAPIVP